MIEAGCVDELVCQGISLSHARRWSPGFGCDDEDDADAEDEDGNNNEEEDDDTGCL